MQAGVQLSKYVKRGVVAEQLAEKHVGVIEHVKKKLEASNTNYKVIADTHRRQKTF